MNSPQNPPQSEARAADEWRDMPIDDEEMATFDLVRSDVLTHYTAKSDILNPVKLLRDIVADFFGGREVAWRLFLRNIRGLYRQTLLGLFWAILPPLANTAVWLFLRQQGVFDIGDTGVNGAVYILTGMILWQTFTDSFQLPMDVLRRNESMIRKLRFSRESLLLVGVGEVLFDFAIRILLLIPAFLIFQVPIHATLLLMPLAVVLMIMWGMALGLFLMPVGSLYHDVGRFLGMALPFWMIVTPVIYVLPQNRFGELLVWLNPASPLLMLARDWTLLGTSTAPTAALVYALIAVPAFLLGLIVYRISMPILIERMSA